MSIWVRKRASAIADAAGRHAGLTADPVIQAKVARLYHEARDVERGFNLDAFKVTQLQNTMCELCKSQEMGHSDFDDEFGQCSLTKDSNKVCWLSVP